MNRILLTSQRRLNFGWWHTGQSGLYRRIRGQGLSHHKQYDAMPMTEDPRVSKEHPRLQKWIKRRKRDQEWGDKWFPIFPDILFYVKGFLKIEKIFSKNKLKHVYSSTSGTLAVQR